MNDKPRTTFEMEMIECSREQSAALKKLTDEPEPQPTKQQRKLEAVRKFMIKRHEKLGDDFTANRLRNARF